MGDWLGAKWRVIAALSSGQFQDGRSSPSFGRARALALALALALSPCIVRECTLAVALVAPSGSAIVIGDGIVRVELYRLGVVGDGAVVVSFGAPGGA
jgi:hypothetical protein